MESLLERGISFPAAGAGLCFALVSGIIMKLISYSYTERTSLLTKLSSDNKPLAGVTFRLARIEDGSRYLDRTTSSTGEIVWEGLEPGVYSLQEISTVDTHILDDTCLLYTSPSPRD